MIRAATFAAGLALAAYGGWRLLELGTDNLVATVTWLVGGVVLHDALLAPATIALALVSVSVASARRRWWPWLSSGAVALVVLAPVTILSIPVLGRFGARPSEPSLLDRHYWTGWLGLVVVVGIAILVAAWVGGDDGQGDGGR